MVVGIVALDRDYKSRHQQNTKGPDAGRASGPKRGRRKTLAHPKSQHHEVSFATRHAAVTNATSTDFLIEGNSVRLGFMKLQTRQ